ncbi:MAG TPA: hypothetical protein VKV24_03595, partial [Casimicrobiaceae bacterium]|nr:hypothetical protein [Casimicrobiaceae bacterium]
AASPMLAGLAKEEFVQRFERELPSATACFLDDFEACTAHLRLPIAHPKRFAPPICSSACSAKSADARK